MSHTKTNHPMVEQTDQDLSSHPSQGRTKQPVNPEVKPEKPKRRFTAAYKLRILEEVDRCHEPGAIGAILRREGIDSSYLSEWRQARERGALSALSQPKGRKKSMSPESRQIQEMEREISQLKTKLAQAESIIDVQKKSPRSLASRRLPIQPTRRIDDSS